MGIAEKVKEYCSGKGISVAEFAKQCGFDKSLVNRWEKKANPSLRILLSIEKETGIPITEWIGEKEAS